jgi:hypothetical protein
VRPDRVRVHHDQVSEPADASLRFVGVSLDCADVDQLAEFYLRLLGGRVLWNRPTSVGVQVPGLLLVPQHVEGYRPPVWPGSSIVHLDLTAGDGLDEPVARAVALGARPADHQPDPRWTVLLDPAGHPFCITTVAPREPLATGDTQASVAPAGLVRTQLPSTRGASAP